MGEVAYVTLALVGGIGRARLETLLSVFGSAEAVLSASQRNLKAVAGMTAAAATAVRQASLEHGRRVIERAEELGGAVLVPSDPRFPPILREIPDAPTLLFALGQLEQPKGRSVAIVGSRTHTRYGSGACRMFASGAVRAGLVVVSGMARGLDAVAHTAALDAGGGTVGVLGNGLGVVYPAANRALYQRVESAGCLLTEFPPGERPHAGSFPRRNRLISGLALCTLVVEARERSGALITVDCALTQGRDVLAVPGPITSPVSVGCNRLIQLGAKPALGLRDLLEEYGVADAHAPAARLPTDLSEDERRVLDILESEPVQVDLVARSLGRPAGETLAVLTSLEIRGIIGQEPGKLFHRLSEIRR